MQVDARLQKNQTEIIHRSTVAYDEFITFCALGGLIIQDEGFDVKSGKKISNMIKQLSLAEFCNMVGVNQATTWRWRKEPNFAIKIRERRAEIVPLARETKAWNQLFLLGMQMQDKRAAVDALKTYLGHFSNLQLPTQRSEVEVGNNLMDLLNVARKKNVIEGEVVDDTKTSS